MKSDHLHAFEYTKDGLSIFNPVYLGDTSPIFESHKITDIAELFWMSDNLLISNTLVDEFPYLLEFLNKIDDIRYDIIYPKNIRDALAGKLKDAWKIDPNDPEVVRIEITSYAKDLLKDKVPNELKNFFYDSYFNPLIEFMPWYTYYPHGYRIFKGYEDFCFFDPLRMLRFALCSDFIISSLLNRCPCIFSKQILDNALSEPRYINTKGDEISIEFLNLFDVPQDATKLLKVKSTIDLGKILPGDDSILATKQILQRPIFDYSNLHEEDLIKFRKNPALSAFRNKMQVSSTESNSPNQMTDDVFEEYTELIKEMHIKEKILNKLQTIGTMFCVLGFYLPPIGSIIHPVMSIFELTQTVNKFESPISWYYFLSDLSKKV
jgi:hypothetical protein